jgi:hypothetical protein
LRKVEQGDLAVLLLHLLTFLAASETHAALEQIAERPGVRSDSRQLVFFGERSGVRGSGRGQQGACLKKISSVHEFSFLVDYWPHYKKVQIILVGPPILAAAALSRRLPDKVNSAGGNADAPP